IAGVRKRHAHACFMAATPGSSPTETTALAGCGFDLVVYCSSAWDYRAAGFGETVDCLTQIAPLVGMPEAPFGRRLGAGFSDSGRARRAAARAFEFTTSLGVGWLIPMGFEYGATRDMDSSRDRPEDFEHLVAAAPFDLTTEIAAVNTQRTIPLEKDGSDSARILSSPGAPAAVLLATRPQDHAARPTLIFVNASLDDPVRVAVAPLLTASGLPGAMLEEKANNLRVGPDEAIIIRPGAVRVLSAIATSPIASSPLDVTAAAAAPRIAIEAVSPSVD